MKNMSDELRKQMAQVLIYKAAVEGGNTKLAEEVKKKAEKDKVKLEVVE